MVDTKKITRITGATVAMGESIPAVGQAFRPAGYCFF